VSRPPRQFDREEREVEFSRALAFSDGVFGVAITLLITTIDVPDVSGPNLESQLVDALKDLDGPIISYFISFAVIGLMWMHHHRLFSRIRRVNTTALWLNLLSLAFIVLMPFTTELMGRYNDAPIAIAVYALNIALAVVAYTLLWWYCAARDMLGEHLTRAQIRYELVTRLFIAVGFLISIPIAWASTRWAQYSWAIFPILQWRGAAWLEKTGRAPTTLEDE
jgi:uncharacterized membrane protein